MEAMHTNSMDDELLETLKGTVLDNLNNEQFSVANLSEQVGISRSHLHRKLKLLKGQSVSQFIREVRLEEAMKLLKEDVATASEIAYRVGFSSTSYFNRCFSARYGYPPGEAKKRSQNTEKEAEPLAGFDKGIYHKAKIQHPRHIQTKVLWLAGIPLIILLAVYAFYSESTEGVKVQPRSIAVLPLDNLTGDPEQDYLAAGMHDALIAELGKITSFRVISKTSTLKYARSKMLMREVASELDVDMIVEGSVFVTGDSFRIHLQLIAPFPEEKRLWGQEYYQDISQVLKMQNTVIHDMVQEIQLNLTSKEKSMLAQQRTVNPETYKAYLRGMYYLQKPTPEARKRGLEYLHQAVDHDPADPYAYVGLSLGYIAEGHSANSSSDAFIRAKAAAKQALKLDSTIVEAHAALGRIYLYYDWNWEAAERAFRYVNQVNPSMASNHYHYAWYLNLMGRKEEAIAEHVLAKELDPLGPKNTAWLAWLYASYGEFEKAELEARKALALDSTFDVAYLALGLIREKQQKYSDALEVYRQLLAIYPNRIGLLGSAYARAGLEGEARKILAELDKMPPSPWKAFVLFDMHASLNENEQALEWLKYEPHHAYIPWARVSPYKNTLKDDPRFHQFLHKINLPPPPASAQL